jgi:hypothetical protein
MMADKQMYHMKDDARYAGEFSLTEDEAVQLRTKGWLVVRVADTRAAPQGHMHVVSADGHYLGARMLTQLAAADLQRMGMHLVHVGDASKDPYEVRAIRQSME